MATIEECRTALDQLSSIMGGAEGDAKKTLGFDRTLSCRITDLDTVFSGRLYEGEIRDITTETAPKAQIRLAMTGDDLLALVAGELNFASAWARGRIKLDASFKDMLTLRKLL